MADEIKIDKAIFTRRAAELLAKFKPTANDEKDETLGGVDSVAIIMGGQNDEVAYSKTASLHTWLLGYEFPSTLAVFDKKGILFVTSATKTKYLEGLSSSKVDVKVLKRTKDDAANARIWEQVLERLEGEGKRVGVLPKEKQIGKVAEEWVAAWDAKVAADELEPVDVGLALSAAFASKDEEELKSIRIAARMSSGVLNKYFVDEMGGIFDDGRKITHEKLAAKVEDQLENASLWKKVKGAEGADFGLADWCYTPIIQSGGKYDLRTSAISSEDRLEGADGGGCVIASMGLKYKSYCANVGRTFLIDPVKSQLKTFTILLELQTEIVEKYLREGATCREVYERAKKFVESKNKDLVPHFVKNLGFAIGIEFRDGNYALSVKNTRKIRKDMTFNISVGFSDLDDPNHKDQTYSLLLIDTVRVNGDGPATMLTDRLRSPADCVFYKDDDEADGDAAKKSPKKKEPQNVTAGGKVLRNKGRGDGNDAGASNKLREHQKELALQKQEDGLARYAEEQGDDGTQKGKVFKKFESYKRDFNFPTKTQDLRIFVDQKAQTVFLPIFRFAVPYHINTIKNVSKSEEGALTYLRFNFVTPGQIVGKKEDVPFEDPSATFVRSMSFRSDNQGHFSELFREISELRKAATKRETEKKEMADVVEQDKLIINKSRTHALRDVFPRPALDGKRVPGDVEIHQNGLRYTTRSNQIIDVLFNNMKHIFFQPCDKELVVILHVHLKAPILIGKKKTRDIQFYREASDVNFDETGTRKRKYRGGDEDEIELEQEEKRRRSQLNKEFKNFGQKVADASEGRVTLDVPFRELGFNGVGFRSNVLLQPTTDCLVHLTDPPFTVVTLADVEIVHLERVTLSASTSASFDIVFVFSDFSLAPVIIRSVPIASLDHVKEWLDSVDLCISSGPVNLNWSQIMKTIRDDPHEFYVGGGFSFLRSSDTDSDASDSEEDGSDFSKEVDESDIYASSESEPEEGSDFGSEENSDSGSAASGDSDDSGADWDEMEKRAARADQKKARGEDSDDDGGKKKKSSSSKRR